jgi:hypothetical protein
MAVTVTPDLITVDSADTADATWTGESTITLESDIMIQGVGCGSAVARNATRAYYYNMGASRDLTNMHIYSWMQSTAGRFLDTYANGGLRIYVRNAGGSWGSWSVAGRDTYDGGWKLFVVDCNRPFDFSSGTISVNSIQYIGIQTVVGLGKNVINTYFDVIRYGKGLKISGGSAGDPATFDNIYQQDSLSSNKYGIVDRVAGLYVLRGSLQFGLSTNGTATYFKDSNIIASFENNPLVSDDLYKFTVTGNSTSPTFFQLGEVVGSGEDSIGQQGVTILSGSSSRRFVFEARSPNIGSLNIYGSKFQNTKNIFLGPSGTNVAGLTITANIIDTTFDNINTIYKNLSGSNTFFLRNTASNSISTTAGILSSQLNEDGNEFALISTSGWNTTRSNETINISNYQSRNPFYDAIIDLSKNNIWNFINPTWTYPKFKWVSLGTSTTAYEKFSLSYLIADPSGSGYENARFMIYDQGTSAITNFVSSDTGGNISSNVITRLWTLTGSASASFGPFLLKVFRHGQSPFQAAVTIASPIESQITMVSDTNIGLSEIATSAIQVGIENYQANPLVRIEFVDGVSAFTTGMAISGQTSGIIGYILQSNSDSEGSLVLSGKTGNYFTSGEKIAISGVSPDIATVSFSGQHFTWLVDAKSDTLYNIYNRLSVLSASSNPSSIIQEVQKWGTQLIKYSGGYFTEMSQGKGVYIINASDSFSYLTGDNGVQYTPPTTVTLEINGVVEGTRVYIDEDFIQPSIMNQLADSFGKATILYTFKGSDVPVFIRARKAGYLPFNGQGTITSEGLTVTAIWQEDPNYVVY